MHTYRNTNTGDVHTFPERHPELEALPNWTELTDVEVPESAQRAAAVAAAERAAIEAAQGHRYDRTVADGEGAANEYANRSTSREGGPPAPVRAVGVPPAGTPVPVLSDPGLKIGGLHPNTEGAGGAKAVANLAAEQALNPPVGGVLARAKADQRSGAVQIGDNPEEHDAVRAAIKPETVKPKARTKAKAATEGTDGATPAAGPDDAGRSTEDKGEGKPPADPPDA